VRQEVESGHQHRGSWPISSIQHLFELAKEDAYLEPGGVDGVIPLLLSITEEDIAFGKKGAQHDSESRNLVPVAAVQNGDVKSKVVVNDGGDEVTESVSLLHDTAQAGKTMSPDRHRGVSRKPDHGYLPRRHRKGFGGTVARSYQTSLMSLRNLLS